MGAEAAAASANAESGGGGGGGAKVKKEKGGGTGTGPVGARKATRPKKKARAATPPAAAAASALGAGEGGVGVEVEGARTVPENMAQYRDGCVRLEKARHEKVYQAEKRLLYAERAIEQAHEWEVRSAQEAYSLGVRQAMERMLMDNLARAQRIEEARYGVAHRPSEATLASGHYSNGGRPHGMSLRERRNGNGGLGSGDERTRAGTPAPLQDELPPVDGGRTSRRGGGGGAARKERAAAHRHIPSDFKMALDDVSVMEDLAKINRGKRQRDDANLGERRTKKRK